MTLHGNISTGYRPGRAPKDAASLLVYTQKKIFAWG